MDWSPVVPSRGPGSGCLPGAAALTAATLSAWSSEGLTSLGCFNPRRIAGTDSWSVHAEGRAIDVGVTGATPAAVSACLAALLDMGDNTLQLILFDHRVYDRSSPFGRSFSGSNPHTDHMHVELSWAAARGDIPLGFLTAIPPEDDDVPALIVAYNGAQFVVAPDLSNAVGLSQSADVTALLKVNGGRSFVPATLSATLMQRIVAAS